MTTAAQQSFYEQLVAQLNAPEGLGDARRLRDAVGTMRFGGKFMDVVKNLFKSIDVSSLTKEEFLAAVGMAWDTVAAPLFSSMGPMGPLVAAASKSLVMILAGKFYDNHSKSVPVAA